MTNFPDVWYFDINRRVYRKGGRGAPIWREHWRKLTIVGETSRSWVSSCGHKVPKSGGQGYAFSQAEIDDAALLAQRWQIADKVRYVSDINLLKQIAKLVDYVPELND